MISINNLSIHFDGNYLFENISFTIGKKGKVGLVGRNGAGKTTLLRIIAGIQEPEKGAVVIPDGVTIGYLPQETDIESSKTIIDETMTAFSEVLELESKIKKYNDEISCRTDYESKDYLKLILKLTEANDKFQLIGGNTIHANIEKVLLGLGFPHSDFKRGMGEFSSGWQMRIELAKILLQKPDIILLDEPTNHLDIESIQWVEEFLINYQGIVIMVAHDRAFLDNITNRTIEISKGKLYDYNACYSEYMIMREDRLEHEKASYNNQQREIEQIRRFITRFRYKSTKARQVQSRIKLLDKMDKIEVDQFERSSIHFSFPPAPSSGKVVFESINLSKSYGNINVLNDLTFSVIKGERIAFVGKNGEGKTTLSKIIVSELDCDGEAIPGYNVSIGYVPQNPTELLDVNKTVFETIDDIAVGDMRTKVKGLLGSFLFSGEDIDKKVKVLSGGEKSRLSIAKLLLTPSNLLVLDEPTNHLDMRSKDILKNALLHYTGTLIIVSHDRDFLQGLTNKVYEFKNHKIKEYIGDIYDFLENRKIESLKQLEIAVKAQKNKQKSVTASENKINREKKKKFERDVRKLKNQISNCEAEIAGLENEIKLKDEMLSNPEQFQDEISSGDLFKEYEELKSRLNKKMMYWEGLNSELEGLQ